MVSLQGVNDFGRDKLTGRVCRSIFAEPLGLSRPMTPRQLHDQWRNSGGASGSTILPCSTQRESIVRRYGVVRRRFGLDNLRYHEYSFTDRRAGDFRLFHTVTPPCP